MSQQPTVLDAPDGAEGVMQEFALAEAQYTQAKEAFNEVKKRLVALFGEKLIGKFEMTAGKWKATADVPAKVVWNSEELAAYYGTEIPAHVDRKLSLKETAWKSLSNEERLALQGARDEQPGSPKYEVEVVR